ncbi:hypothetical protein IV203_016919 [Nitzschia inconspicua]|uniref:Uncharacterized protein n=1 Tax=Nitzschia inconspicua TaxID=303405 RepID=A0A9K3KQR0_9STRA|nr:hypothetical protein IV203_016919 [Nitzschia inconspicua]
MINEIDDKILQAARNKLSWEIVQETQQKPILNLSARDLSPESTIEGTSAVERNYDDISSWKNGERWTATKQLLESLGVDISNEVDILSQCPQLLRLESFMVEETASCIIDLFDVEYVQSEWQLLSYPLDDVVYGLEFVSTMMMMPQSDTRTICAQSSALLLQGIQGGIQERAVQTALGAASEVTSQATKAIASDTMKSFRQLRTNRRNKI